MRAQLRRLTAELVSSEQPRTTDEIVAEIKTVKVQRERLAAEPLDPEVGDPERALEWLSSLVRLWQQKRPRGEDLSSRSRPRLRSLWWAILDSNQ